MIRIATERDIPRIKELWQQAFDDPINYVDFFYKNVAPVTKTYLCDEGPGVVAMLTMLPATFVYKDMSVDVSYIYGAATDKKYRGRGFMSVLLRHCEKTAKEAGCAMSVLVPGGRHLFDFYQKRGYRADFSLKLVNIRPGMLTAPPEKGYRFSVDGVKPETVFEIRERALSDTPHVRWGEAEISAVLRDCREYGELTALCERGDERAYAVFGMNGKRMIIKECLGTSRSATTEVLKRLIREKDPSGAAARLESGSTIFGYEGEIVPFGMAKQLVASSGIKDMEPYMNLMLD